MGVPHMATERASLRVSLVAYLACERLLASMSPKVVLQVTRLLEHCIASWELTFEHVLVSVRFGINAPDRLLPLVLVGG